MPSPIGILQKLGQLAALGLQRVFPNFEKKFVGNEAKRVESAVVSDRTRTDYIRAHLRSDHPDFAHLQQEIGKLSDHFIPEVTRAAGARVRGVDARNVSALSPEQRDAYKLLQSCWVRTEGIIEKNHAKIKASTDVAVADGLRKQNATLSEAALDSGAQGALRLRHAKEFVDSLGEVAQRDPAYTVSRLSTYAKTPDKLAELRAMVSRDEASKVITPDVALAVAKRNNPKGPLPRAWENEVLIMANAQIAHHPAEALVWLEKHLHDFSAPAGQAGALDLAVKAVRDMGNYTQPIQGVMPQTILAQMIAHTPVSAAAEKKVLDAWTQMNTHLHEAGRPDLVARAANEAIALTNGPAATSALGQAARAATGPDVIRVPKADQLGDTTPFDFSKFKGSKDYHSGGKPAEPARGGRAYLAETTERPLNALRDPNNLSAVESFAATSARRPGDAVVLPAQTGLHHDKDGIEVTEWHVNVVDFRKMFSSGNPAAEGTSIITPLKPSGP